MSWQTEQSKFSNSVLRLKSSEVRLLREQSKSVNDEKNSIPRSDVKDGRDDTTIRSISCTSSSEICAASGMYPLYSSMLANSGSKPAVMSFGPMTATVAVHGGGAALAAPSHGSVFCIFGQGRSGESERFADPQREGRLIQDDFRHDNDGVSGIVVLFATGRNNGGKNQKKQMSFHRSCINGLPRQI